MGVKCRYFDCLVFFFSEEEKNQAFFSLLFSHLSLLSKPLREGISGHLRSETDAEREERPLVFITRAVKVFCFWVSASCCFGSSTCIS